MSNDSIKSIIVMNAEDDLISTRIESAKFIGVLNSSGILVAVQFLPHEVSRFFWFLTAGSFLGGAILAFTTLMTIECFRQSRLKTAVDGTDKNLSWLFWPGGSSISLSLAILILSYIAFLWGAMLFGFLHETYFSGGSHPTLGAFTGHCPQ